MNSDKWHLADRSCLAAKLKNPADSTAISEKYMPFGLFLTGPLSRALAMKALAAGDKATARKQARKALDRDKAQDIDMDHRALLYAVLDEEAQIIRTFEHATVGEGMWAIDG